MWLIGLCGEEAPWIWLGRGEQEVRTCAFQMQDCLPDPGRVPHLRIVVTVHCGDSAVRLPLFILHVLRLRGLGSPPGATQLLSDGSGHVIWATHPRYPGFCLPQEGWERRRGCSQQLSWPQSPALASYKEHLQLSQMGACGPEESRILLEVIQEQDEA